MSSATSTRLSPSSAQSASERPSALAAWLSAARPQTLAVSVAPIAVASALAQADGAFAPLAALAAFLGAVAIQIGTNLHNDASDFARGADTEERIGPARATQRGWLSGAQVQRAALASFALAALFGAYLIHVAGWPLLAIGVTSILCGLAYTGGPFPLAYHGLGDVFVLAFFGVVATCGAYYVQALALPPRVIVASLPLGLLATGVLVVNNLRDRHGDALANKRTLAVRWGERAARAEYALCVGGAFLVPLVAWAAGLVPAGWLLSLLALPLGVVQVRRLLRLDGAELNPQLGATARLQLIFGLLLAGGVLL